MIPLVKALLTALVVVLNAAYDSPHEPESRPDFAELCWSDTRVWIEIAGPQSYVCDGTGTKLVIWRME